jgi:Ser/Thr protein kinase RdoA (MazF antagonist)
VTELRPEVLEWCERELGPTDGVELLREEMSAVFLAGLRDGRRVVVKVREDPEGRAVGCVEAQTRVWAAGLPCPGPLTGLGRVGLLSVHAETWVPDGEVLLGDGPEIAELCAGLLADVMAALAGFARSVLPLPNPDWVRWDYEGRGEWPPHISIDAAPNQSPLPGYLDDVARRVRARMKRCMLPKVIGHGDWEAQNLRWRDRRPVAIHDWDSAVYLPEAAVVGAAAGAFASNETPTLAPLESSAAFLDAYQQRRGRRFTPEETQVAWATSLWPAIHNARAEYRFNLPPVASGPLEYQSLARLARRCLSARSQPSECAVSITRNAPTEPGRRALRRRLLRPPQSRQPDRPGGGSAGDPFHAEAGVGLPSAARMVAVDRRRQRRRGKRASAVLGAGDGPAVARVTPV